MPRLIDADALFTELWKNTEWYDNQDREIALDKALDAPTIDAEPVRHGRWECDDFDGDGLDYCCTTCNRFSRQNHDYCPACGAKMDAKEDE